MTLVDYCKLPQVGHTLDGSTLRPVIEDAFYEMAKPSMTFFEGGSVGMRTKDWRYIHYYDGGEELYDRHKDPKEWKNRAGDAKYKKIKAAFQPWVPQKITARAGPKQKK